MRVRLREALFVLLLLIGAVALVGFGAPPGSGLVMPVSIAAGLLLVAVAIAVNRGRGKQPR
jgi:hypothetical protein